MLNIHMKKTVFNMKREYAKEPYFTIILLPSCGSDGCI